MKKIKSIILVGMLLMMVVGCAHSNTNSEGRYHMNTFTKNTKVYDVINNTSFKGYGKLIFPVDRKIDKDMTLDESKSLYSKNVYVFDIQCYVSVIFCTDPSDFRYGKRYVRRTGYWC